VSAFDDLAGPLRQSAEELLERMGYLPVAANRWRILPIDGGFELDITERPYRPEPAPVQAPRWANSLAAAALAREAVASTRLDGETHSLVEDEPQPQPQLDLRAEGDEDTMPHREAAELLGVHAATIANWVKSGKIESKVGKWGKRPTRAAVERLTPKPRGAR
jgi:hypothetical protein